MQKQLRIWGLPSVFEFQEKFKKKKRGKQIYLFLIYLASYYVWRNLAVRGLRMEMMIGGIIGVDADEL